jgi:hypothetical protein
MSIPRITLARISAKAVMDGGRGDHRVTSGNRELMKIANDVPGRIEAFHACPLLRVDDHIEALQTSERSRSRRVGLQNVSIFLERNWDCGVYRCFDSADSPAPVRVLRSVRLRPAASSQWRLEWPPSPSPACVSCQVRLVQRINQPPLCDGIGAAVVHWRRGRSAEIFASAPDSNPAGAAMAPRGLLYLGSVRPSQKL